MIQRIYSLLPIMLLCCLGVVRGQQLDSMINLYGEKFPQEKIYVHFDKSYYNAGETIWFKAYLMSGISLSDMSKTIYAELADETGTIVQKKILPVLRSSGFSSFDIPAGYTKQRLHFRAYTTWMLNFDTAFLYNKIIPIVSAPAAKPAPAAAAVSLRFFPEGGDPVNGLSNSIAFKATDSYGFPVAVSGAIKNNKGATVTTFSSVHDGMGKFELEPDASTSYYAEWKDKKGKTYKTNLPAARNNGAVLQMISTQKILTFLIKRSVESGPELQRVFVVANMNHQVIYKAAINLSTNFMTSGTIPLKELPSGIVELTLFNANWQPLAERIVFVNNSDYIFDAYLNAVIKKLSKRAKNTLRLEVPDTTLANLSISVTDADVNVPNENEDNIYSNFLISSELRGYIHNAGYYFSSYADSVRRHLDLVMLTNGWRKFKWEDLAAGKFPPVNMPEGYLTVKGTIKPAHLAAGKLLNVFIEFKNAPMQLLSAPVSKEGTFVIEGMAFYDTAKIHYQFNQDKTLADRVAIQLDNGFYKNTSPGFLPSVAPPALIQDSVVAKNKQIAAGYLSEEERKKKVKTLEAVTVTAKQKSPKDLMDEKYARGMFSGGDAISFDMINDPFAASALNIFQFLQGRVAGLQVNMGGANGPSLTWQQSPTTLFLDEMPVDANTIQSIPVQDIAYVKALRPPFFGAPGGGAGGAIAIYTRKGNDRASNEPVKGLSKMNLLGYSTVKEFYSPDYSRDVTPPDTDARTTLYWNPYIILGKDKKTIDLSFYNNDITKRFRVIVEGVNEEGKLTRIEEIIK